MPPIEAITLIVAIIRAKQFKTRYVEAADALMSLVSYALHTFAPVPNMMAAEPTDEQLVECRAALEGLSDDSATMCAADDPEAVNPMLIALFYKIGMEVLTMLLNRKKP